MISTIFKVSLKLLTISNEQQIYFASKDYMNRYLPVGGPSHLFCNALFMDRPLLLMKSIQPDFYER